MRYCYAMKKSVLFVLVSLFACKGSPSAPMIGAEESGRISVDFGVSPDRLSLDPYQIEQARIEKDTLYINVVHGGGCRKHEYGFVAFSGWMESFPVQVRAVLAHDANGDLCKALLRNQLRFDLTPLREAY